MVVLEIRRLGLGLGCHGCCQASPYSEDVAAVLTYPKTHSGGERWTTNAIVVDSEVSYQDCCSAHTADLDLSCDDQTRTHDGDRLGSDGDGCDVESPRHLGNGDCGG